MKYWTQAKQNCLELRFCHHMTSDIIVFTKNNKKTHKQKTQTNKHSKTQTNKQKHKQTNKNKNKNKKQKATVKTNETANCK